MNTFWIEEPCANLFLFKKYGDWRKIKYKKINIFFAGFCYKKDTKSYWKIDELVKEILKKKNKFELECFLKDLDGHYTIVIKPNKGILIISDWINSYPIYYIYEDHIYTLSNFPKSIKKKLDNKKINYQAVLEVLAGGYTLGDKTIYTQITKFPPGAIGYIKNGILKKIRYMMYFPGKYNKTKLNYTKLKKKFIDVLDQTFSRLVKSNHDRKIFIPLSAGLDSRLILSGVLRHGHKNVTCYSYGLKGNTDTKIAKNITQKLNIPFLEIVTGPKIVRSFSNTETFKNYQKFCETYSSVPFSQDLPALHYFFKDKKIPKEALFINGNTGDFISGGHIPCSPDLSKNKSLKLDDLKNLFLDKHYSLWNKYNETPFRSKLENEFELILNNLIIEKEKKFNLFNFFEVMEWYHRQIKFVISGQKVYEFLNREWRLPLWEFPIKNFFEQLNHTYKQDQFFYRKCLMEANWQGIWNNFPVNKKKIFPIWIRPIRYFLKSIYFFIGKEKWYDVERKYINYWTSNTSSYSLVPYYDSILNKDIFKNPISLRSIRYLERHGLTEKDKSYKNFIEN